MQSGRDLRVVTIKVCKGGGAFYHSCAGRPARCPLCRSISLLLPQKLLQPEGGGRHASTLTARPTRVGAAMPVCMLRLLPAALFAVACQPCCVSEQLAAVGCWCVRDSHRQHVVVLRAACNTCSPGATRRCLTFGCVPTGKVVASRWSRLLMHWAVLFCLQLWLRNLNMLALAYRCCAVWLGIVGDSYLYHTYVVDMGHVTAWNALPHHFSASMTRGVCAAIHCCVPLQLAACCTQTADQPHVVSHLAQTMALCVL